MNAPLSSKSVTLNGSGAGTIVLDQVPPFRKWSIDRISVTITGGASSLGGEARIYKGEAIDSNFIDGTATPWLDVATYGGALVLMPPEALRVVFSGCLAGATASVTIQGEASPL